MAARRTTVDVSSVLAGLDKLRDSQEPIARAMGVAMGVEVRDEAAVRGGEALDVEVAGGVGACARRAVGVLAAQLERTRQLQASGGRQGAPGMRRTPRG